MNQAIYYGSEKKYQINSVAIMGSHLRFIPIVICPHITTRPHIATNDNIHIIAIKLSKSTKIQVLAR